MTALAGVGEILGKKLKSKGLEKAEDVFAQFLMMKKNKNKFEEWMKELGANKKTAGDCYQCLSDWYEEFF